MINSTLEVVSIRPCVKCGAIERYANGKCKACTKLMAVAWKAANPERCKANMVAWNLANPERAKSNKVAWRAANLEFAKANAAAWRAANIEWANETRAAWKAANPESSKAASAAWKAANPERRKSTYAAWAAANPDAVRIKSQNRRAKKCINGGKLSKGLTAKLFGLQRGMCPCCKQPLGDDYHLDHIKPIAMGGRNEDSNIQLLRSTCNLSKSAKHPIDFMQSRGFLI